MKTLLLVRHAKSSWDYPGLTDFERPLNKRGHRNAPFMGKLLKEKKVIPELIISSPATRAITTARLFATALEYPLEKISTDERLYDANYLEIKEVISEVENKVMCLMIVSHNPGLTDAADHLTGKYIDNIVTSAILNLNFETDSWSKINSKNVSIEFYEYPKKYF